jgi:hypothetical protein
VVARERRRRNRTLRTRATPASPLACLAALAILTLVMFGDVLFAATPVVLSNRNTDLAGQFLGWRAFGFAELARGNLALWNPHLFSGAPFFGGFQAALLYPPNALFLVLPLHHAVNWTIALHVFLAGAFTFAWATHRGLRPVAACVAAVVFMFCGAHFFHIYAGHLSNLCTMIWAPLLFLAIDALAAAPSLRWTLLGMFAVAMQMLAGHPQYVFYTTVAAAAYAALCLLAASQRRRLVAALVAVALGGAALSAVQWLTGWQESRETLRSVGLRPEFAAMFSLPPENFVTLVAPQFFGDLKAVPYWGRWYLWEMSLFIGATGLVLAVVGATWGEPRGRRSSVTLIALLVVLALGNHTPLFALLYDWLPGFDRFRGHAKAMALASLFAAMLAGSGCNELLNRRRLPAPFTVGVAAVALALFLAAGLVLLSAGEPLTGSRWHALMLAVRDSGESYLPPGVSAGPEFVLEAGRTAARSLLVAGATVAVVALVLVGRSVYPAAAWVLPALLVVELFVFARGTLDSFDPAQTSSTAATQYLESHPGDYRIHDRRAPNAALRSGAFELWGDDPGAMRRYAQLVALTQAVPPDETTQYMSFSRDHALLGMLRRRAIFSADGGPAPASERLDALPHVLVVPRYRVVTDRDQLFAALDSPTFNPRDEVLLESPPQLQAATAGGSPATATIVDSSSDHLTIEAETPSPAVLLITDAYAIGWRAQALPGSTQQEYHVMPGNHCLRAIPLAAGRHRVRLEYAPSGFRIGRWISLLAALGFAVSVAREFLRSTWRGSASEQP